MAALGAGAGVTLNGVINLARGRNFFEGWQQAAVGGAVGAASAGFVAGPGAVAALFGRASAAAAGSAAGAGASAGARRITLEMAKQGKHVPGHSNYIPGRSIFTHSDAQGLLDAFAGKGQAIRGMAGQAGAKELVDFGVVIGRVEINGVLRETTKGMIHYSNRGAHIVPAR